MDFCSFWIESDVYSKRALPVRTFHNLILSTYKAANLKQIVCRKYGIELNINGSGRTPIILKISSNSVGGKILD